MQRQKTPPWPCSRNSTRSTGAPSAPSATAAPIATRKALPYLRFNIEAYDIFAEWRSALEARLRSGELHVALEAHLAKYRKLVPGLALIYHLADSFTGPTGRLAQTQDLPEADDCPVRKVRACFLPVGTRI
jgi:hypothetical protein